MPVACLAFIAEFPLVALTKSNCFCLLISRLTVFSRSRFSPPLQITKVTIDSTDFWRQSANSWIIRFEKWTFFRWSIGSTVDWNSIDVGPSFHSGCWNRQEFSCQLTKIDDFYGHGGLFKWKFTKLTNNLLKTDQIFDGNDRPERSNATESPCKPARDFHKMEINRMLSWIEKAALHFRNKRGGISQPVWDLALSIWRSQVKSWVAATRYALANSLSRCDYLFHRFGLFAFGSCQLLLPHIFFLNFSSPPPQKKRWIILAWKRPWKWTDATRWDSKWRIFSRASWNEFQFIQMSGPRAALLLDWAPLMLLLLLFTINLMCWWLAGGQNFLNTFRRWKRKSANGASSSSSFSCCCCCCCSCCCFVVD